MSFANLQSPVCVATEFGGQGGLTRVSGLSKNSIRWIYGNTTLSKIATIKNERIVLVFIYLTYPKIQSAQDLSHDRPVCMSDPA
jgi:hypothetical protein